MSTYLCQIIGNGIEDDPYRPAIADYSVSWSARIDSDDLGRPLETTCVVEVTAGDVSLFAGDERIEVLP